MNAKRRQRPKQPDYRAFRLHAHNRELPRAMRYHFWHDLSGSICCVMPYPDSNRETSNHERKNIFILGYEKDRAREIMAIPDKTNNSFHPLLMKEDLLGEIK